jgi:peptidoglycan-associated lipoprotein
MHKKIIGCIIVLSLGALVSSGCAKKEMVKSEEPVSTVAPSNTAPAQPEGAIATPAAGKGEAGSANSSNTSTSVEPSKVAKEVAPQPMQLQKIYFNFDSAVLSKNADFLSKQKSLKVRIEGNCDERGSDEYNMALGERRAKAAKDYLGNLGVDTSRLTVISYGVEKPAVDGHDEAAWAKDRRDEFVIVK